MSFQKFFDWSKLWFNLEKFFCQRSVVAQCGHQTLIYGSAKAHDGSVRDIKLDDQNEAGVPPICLNCFEKAIIPCAWCGQSIFPGDPVTLHLLRDNVFFQPPTKAVVYSEDPLCYVGCLRASCTDSGVDRQGFWTPNGVHRVLSPLEQLMISGDDILVIESLSDPIEAVRADCR